MPFANLSPVFSKLTTPTSNHGSYERAGRLPQDDVMQKNGYIGEFEIIDDHRAGKIVVELKGRINKCGVISPRFDVKLADYEKWINNLLPSRQFGHIVVSTTYGIMDHHEARRKHTGGKIIGFFY
ncbi:40S ribosomal protein S15a [Phytophthora cinnamomi]|uniref:40S ribosomal protein S15a n=1 Tax=Phytophthora cinnamomi TaxID=4785 RepID=UPI00355989D2|nr:40S ribosomal protein S15a [Phytophthora cinnamomi]